MVFSSNKYCTVWSEGCFPRKEGSSSWSNTCQISGLAYIDSRVKTWLKLWLSSSWVGSGVGSSAHILVISFITQETWSGRYDKWCNTADFKGCSSTAAGILFLCSILGVVFSVFFNSKYCCRNICNSGHCTIACHSVEPADRATLCSWNLFSVLQSQSFVQLRE